MWLRRMFRCRRPSYLTGIDVTPEQDRAFARQLTEDLVRDPGAVRVTRQFLDQLYASKDRCEAMLRPGVECPRFAMIGQRTCRIHFGPGLPQAAQGN